MPASLGRRDENSVPWGWFILPVVLVVAAFIPILNNGFIADDFINLERAEALKANPLFLFRIPPENFRTTLYVVFAIVKTLAGSRPAAFYVFNILLHATNVLLLGYLLILLTRDSRIAFAASCFFAVFSAPQEAVMWLGGMPESLLACFILLTLILWVNDRPALAAFAYAGALLSKESSVIVIALIPLLDLYRGRRLFRSAYLAILIPTALFGLTFALTWKANTMIASGTYRAGPHVFSLLARSLHRLLWPWFYVVLIAVRLIGGSWPKLRTIALGIGASLLLMLPYMLVAYSPTLPSRNVYLASAALMTAFAFLIGPLIRHRSAQVFMALFILINVAYLWIRKDRQFEERAAPTTALLHALEGRSPQKTLILDFPYAFPDIARASVRLLPGWSSDAIVVGESRDVCLDCRALKWNPQLLTYEEAAN